MEESMRVLQEIMGPNLPVFRMVSVVSVILGLTACFFGYRLKKFWTGFLGLTSGFTAGFLISRIFLESTWLCIGIGILCAVILAGLAFYFYKAGVFLACAVIMFLVIKVLLHGEEWWVYLISALAGAAAGVAGICFVKPMFALVTGFFGAFIALQAVWNMARFTSQVLLYWAAVVLGVCSIAVQLYFAGKREAAKEDWEETASIQKEHAAPDKKRKKENGEGAYTSKEQRERHERRRQNRRDGK